MPRFKHVLKFLSDVGSAQSFWSTFWKLLAQWDVFGENPGCEPHTNKCFADLEGAAGSGNSGLRQQ